MVVGGVDGRRRPTAAVELVSLDPVRRPVPKCLRRLANYPTKVFGAVGGAVKHGSEKKLAFCTCLCHIGLQALYLSSAEARPNPTAATDTILKMTLGPR